MAACLRRLSVVGLYQLLRDLRRARPNRQRDRAEMKVWRRAGYPALPPGVFKRTCLARYAKEHRLPILVATGTLYGDTIFMLRKPFDEIHAIELSPDLHRLAVQAYGHLRHIHLHLGDRTTRLGRILDRLRAGGRFKRLLSSAR